MGLLAKVQIQTVTGETLQLNVGEDQEIHIERHSAIFPAEWYPQSGVQLTWPHAGSDWRDLMPEVTDCYLRMAYEISISEPLVIVTPEPEKVKKLLAEKLPRKATDQILYCQCETNDTWARDHAFLSVIEGGQFSLLDYRFNGWGGKYPAELDNAINRHLYDEGLLRGQYKDCLDFVLEGGSIESDGEGTLLTTSACLLSPGRNPSLGKGDIEKRLLEDLHVRRILWLDHGHLAGDDTDSHIDTLVRFCPGDTIVYTQCEDQGDEHYEDLSLMEKQLQTFRTLHDKAYQLLPLPLPDAIRADGERLPATYANFLIMNTKVLMPIYGQPEKDERARAVLQKVFPRHKITGIDCRVLLRQHGSLHCSTMQYPAHILHNPKDDEQTNH